MAFEKWASICYFEPIPLYYYTIRKTFILYPQKERGTNMEELEFIKISPTENMTILVKTAVPIEQQLEIGKKLMQTNSIGAEQVGFLMTPSHEKTRYALRMMAGEFCRNATLSLGAYVMREQIPEAEIDETQIVELEIYGRSELISCEIQKKERGYMGKIAMPLPISVAEREFEWQGKKYELPVVEFEGITHILLINFDFGEATEGEVEKIVAEMAKEWAEEMPMAYGILLFEKATKTLKPFVTVKGGSAVWEHGCGSGTTAIGAYYAKTLSGSLSLSIRQKGGIMGIDVVCVDGALKELYLKGNILIVGEGVAYL